MEPEAILRDRLRKIEALFAGAATAGEKTAADAAATRIRERLASAAQTEASEEVRFSIPDLWSQQLFIALCRRYGLRPFRYRRMHRQTIIVSAPKSFVDRTLWPEFSALSEALTAYLAEATDRIIRKEVYADTSDVDEVDQRRITAG